MGKMWKTGDVLFVFVILCGLLHINCLPENISGDEPKEEVSDDLFQNIWNSVYQLGDPRQPPKTELWNKTLDLWQKCMYPSHLHDCHSLIEEQKKLETIYSNGTLPSWAVAGNAPWVRGSDEDNLHFTKKAQADLWKHQFSQNCSSPNVKIMMTEWRNISWNGLGSQLHIFSGRLSLAVQHGRVLVMRPGTFEFSQHWGCPKEARGSTDCYFFPLTSKQCEEVAMEHFEKHKNITSPLNKYEFHKVLSSDAKFVFISGYLPDFPQESNAAKKWPNPWLYRKSSVEYFGEKVSLNPKALRTRWWRAQSTRFLFRWPSLHMCQLLNTARDMVYGKHVAYHQKKTCSRMMQIMQTLGDIPSNVFPDRSSKSSVFREVYTPRPIVSMHVRQGDKIVESSIFSLPLHMKYATRLRLMNPSLKYVWLSSESQNVIDESMNISGWHFLFTKNFRQKGSTFWSWGGRPQDVNDFSFVNLILSSEADHFVGNLRSNYGRIIDELRVTNGRLNAGFIAFIHFIF